MVFAVGLEQLAEGQMSRLLLLCFSLTKPVESSPMWLEY